MNSYRVRRIQTEYVYYLTILHSHRTAEHAPDGYVWLPLPRLRPTSESLNKLSPQTPPSTLDSIRSYTNPAASVCAIHSIRGTKWIGRNAHCLTPILAPAPAPDLRADQAVAVPINAGGSPFQGANMPTQYHYLYLWAPCHYQNGI